MEKSFVFNSINGDRKYKAEDFREYFASFIGNGVFPNPSTNLQVISNDNMTITIKQGKAWINGAIYINTDDYIVPIINADGVLNRIDRVVLRMDTAERKIYSYVKKGTFASTPVAPTLQRDADAYELALADIKIDKGIISITQSNITDLRQNKNYCGIVKGTIDEIDATNLFAQYNDEFRRWFEDIKNTLGGDIAGNLLKLITQNTKDITSNSNKIGDTATLKTIDKTSTVQAINEVKKNLDSIKVPVIKVNEQTGDVVLNASDIKMENTKTIEDNINAIANGIGGRNLVLNSLNLHNYFTKWNFEGTCVKMTDNYPVSGQMFKVTCTKSQKGGLFHFPVFKREPQHVGRTYTWSCYILANKTKSMRIGHESGGYKRLDVKTHWDKVYHIWKMTGDTDYSSFSFYADEGFEEGDTFYIADMKIEEGIVPSTWTPAPEDIDAHFSAIEINQGDLKTLKTTDKTSTVQAINELFTSANNGKTAVANAIAAKNVSASPTDTFAILADKIGQIPLRFRKIWYGLEHMEFKLFETNSTSSGTKFTVDGELAIMHLLGSNEYMKVRTTSKVDVTGAKFLITRVALVGYERDKASFTISLLDVNGSSQFSKSFRYDDIYENSNIIELPNLIGEHYVEVSCTTDAYLNNYIQANIWYIILA